MKKWLWGISIGAVVLIIAAFLLGRYALPWDGMAALPEPELSEGQRGELGIDKNVNESTIDNYLGRSDAVYRDMRMLKDPGNYEAVGGDSYLSGFVEGFEVVPLPYIVNVTGLPEAVGETYSGKTLFTQDAEGNYTANYAESLQIIEDLFPKDKVIFLMCGGGGYAGMMKNLLVALGWDETKIYDVGGYWYYEGAHKVEVKRTLADGTSVYDFYKVPYHDLKFDDLTEWSPGDLVDVSVEMYEEMVAEGRSFLLFVDQGGCTTADRLRGYAADYSRATGRVVYRMMFAEVKESSLYNNVKYYPSMVVVSAGEVVGFLRADADEDASAYNDYEAFKEWMRQYFENGA